MIYNIRTKKSQILQKLKTENNEKYKKALKKNITSAEKVAYKILKDNGIKFKFQKGFWTLKGINKGFHCIVDFYIASKNLVIEIDGGYHQSEYQNKKDLFRDNWLKEIKGVQTLRITNDDVYSIMERLNNFHFIKLRRPKRPSGVSWKYWRKNKNRRKFQETY